MPCHAILCYVHCSVRGRGHPGWSRQGAKEEKEAEEDEEEEQEQKAPAYNDIPTSRDDPLERVLLFCGDGKKKKRTRWPCRSLTFVH